MRSLFRRIATARKKVTFASGLLALVLSIGVLGAVHIPKVSAAGDCDSNAIIYCGFSSAGDFINTVRTNDSKNGHHDLQTVYGAYGLDATSKYDDFVKTARQGTAYKDGTIKVDGVVVASSAQSIGRLSKSYSHSKVIGGVTYYESRAQDVFRSNSIPALVYFDDHGAMIFAVLNSCGNPMTGTKVIPSYSCDMLQQTAVAGKANTFSFTTKASATNNAAISEVVYNFGDGSAEVHMANPAAPVEHTYTKEGTFTAQVSVKVKLPGGRTDSVTAANCQKVITIKLPFYQCLQLDGAILDRSKMSFSFVATAKYGNGATLVSADFNFGDGTSTNGVKPTTATTITTTHSYATAGNYSTAAVLHFMVNGQAVTASGTCLAGVTPTTPPTPECKPGVPVGDARCTPCQYDNSLPSDSPQCVAVPPVLPNTGAGNVVAVFGAVAVGGFLIYRQLLFRKHRAAFAAAERGTSPLPLGQPLDDDAPLAGTPLATKRPTFRRKRMF